MCLVNMILVHVTFGVLSPKLNVFGEHDTSVHHSLCFVYRTECV